MTKPKRCPAGQMWVMRDGLSLTYAISSRAPHGWIEAQMFVPQQDKGERKQLEWDRNESMPFCRDGFRRTFGHAPRLKQALLIDTTRRECWCPRCKRWWKNPSWIFNETTEQILSGPGCVECGDKIDTKSRCIVVRRLRLTKDGVKELAI